MIVNENLEYAIIGKFSYCCPDIQNLRKHVLIRATLLEDYVHLLSKPAFYITQKNWSFLMRTLKWDPMLNSEEETSTTIAWISFPSLPPIFLEKKQCFH
ncbi:hypothetical protein H5410_022277 [Solanum commersonii]|uniref:DUF4283 domain-containing protein n=1 Tax=Solanum commersonii TaxID=4109 RepID=A0A9J5ZHK4_SOLCO|nr:hypothetical protein H5410_022277 [Solanum commersonii]